MLEKFIENLLMKSKIEQEVYKKHILPGNLSELEYKFMCGKLKGLQQADDLVRSLYNAMVNQVRISDIKERLIEDEPERY
jgi:hypothetical protein